MPFGKPMHHNLTILTEIEKDLVKLRNSKIYKEMAGTLLTSEITNTVELVQFLYEIQRVFDKNKSNYIELGLMEITFSIDEILTNAHRFIGSTLPRVFLIDEDLKAVFFCLLNSVEAQVERLEKCLNKFNETKNRNLKNTYFTSDGSA